MIFTYGAGSNIVHATTLVSFRLLDKIVNETDGVRVNIAKAAGTIIVPKDWAVNIILELAVTIVLGTVTVPATKVAIPILALDPSLILILFPILFNWILPDISTISTGVVVPNPTFPTGLIRIASAFVTKVSDIGTEPVVTTPSTTAISPFVVAGPETKFPVPSSPKKLRFNRIYFFLSFHIMCWYNTL